VKGMAGEFEAERPSLRVDADLHLSWTTLQALKDCVIATRLDESRGDPRLPNVPAVKRHVLPQVQFDERTRTRLWAKGHPIATRIEQVEPDGRHFITDDDQEASRIGRGTSRVAGTKVRTVECDPCGVTSRQ